MTDEAYCELCENICEGENIFCQECLKYAEIHQELNMTVNDYNVLEKKILELVEKLPRNGQDCSCGNCESFEYIFYGNYREMHSVCVFCGGYVEVQE